MDMTVSQAPGQVEATLLHLKGDLDAATGPEVLQKARELVEGGVRRLVIDLTGVRYISSAGIRTLHQIYMLLRTPGEEAQVLQGLRDGTYSAHSVRLLNPNDAVRTVLTTTGMDMVLAIDSDLDSALAGFEEK